MTDNAISVFILAHDERLHIERCIRAVSHVASEVFVVDSGSKDETVAIARGLGARVVEHAWENNHARQTNWAIDHLPFTGAWVMRIDADEIVGPELAAELRAAVEGAATDVNGLVLKRRQVFMGRPLRFGGAFPIHLLRVWRRGTARCEERWMDEHIVLSSGATLTLQHELVDHNLNELRFWTSKEANYAVREAAEILLARRGDAAGTVPQDLPSRRKRCRSILARMNVEPMTERLAKVAGEAIAAVPGATAVDAVVMASAAQRGDVVFTSDLEDLTRFHNHFPEVRLLGV